MATVATPEWMKGEVLPREGDAEARTESRYYQDAPLFHRDLFEQSLDDESIPAAERDEVLQLRDDYVDRARELHLTEPARPGRPEDLPSFGGEGGDDLPPEIKDLYSRRLRLWDWLAQIGFEAEASETVELRVPLFVISAADDSGCTASIDFYTEKIHQQEWGVTVYGTGLSAAGSLTVTTRSKFTTTNGETKVVFLPVSFRVESGTITKRGKPFGPGRRADMRTLTSSALGILLLAPGAKPPLGERVQRYQLADDTSGASATYEYRYQKKAAHKLSIGAKAFGADLSLNVEVGLVHAITVGYELRGGTDYDLHDLSEGDGLLWKPSNGRAS